MGESEREEREEQDKARDKVREEGEILSVPISCGNNDIYVLWNDTGLSTGDENVGGDDGDGNRTRIRCGCGDFDDCCYDSTWD